MQKKTLLLQSVHKLKRIWILCLISLCIVPLNAQNFYKIEMPNYILQASGTNTETLYITLIPQHYNLTLFISS